MTLYSGKRGANVVASARYVNAPCISDTINTAKVAKVFNLRLHKAKLGSVGGAMPGFGENNPSNKTKRPGNGLPVGVSAMREYVGCMSLELAQMARGNGDEKLAVLLETAACIAREEIRLEA